jgi:hypothetical protein
MLVFWLDEMERVAAGVGVPVPMGRMPDDPGRQQAIESDRTLPTRDLMTRIRTAIGRYVDRLPRFTDEEWTKRGLHPRRGEMTVREMLEVLVLDHIDDHVKQVAQALERRSG